jgi:hypothetical protein
MNQGQNTKAARRQQRLREALRENLKRRKAQARGRSESDPEAPLQQGKSDQVVPDKLKG